MTEYSIKQKIIENLVSDLASKAVDSAVVHNTGNETIAGVKTFSSSPILPALETTDNSDKAASTSFVNSVITEKVFTNNLAQGAWNLGNSYTGIGLDCPNNNAWTVTAPKSGVGFLLINMELNEATEGQYELQFTGTSGSRNRFIATHPDVNMFLVVIDTFVEDQEYSVRFSATEGSSCQFPNDQTVCWCKLFIFG